MSIPADMAPTAQELKAALRELLEQVESLNGYELTRDLVPYKAQACWDDAVERATEILSRGVSK